MMKTDDLENELRKLKLTHLTESELTAYCDQEIDRIGRARVEAHVKQCFICERQLALLREESAALNNRAITAEDVAFVERLTEQKRPAEEPISARPAEAARTVPLQDRLAEYFRQMVANWKIEFAVVRRGEKRGNKDEELWRWQSDDGNLHARATMEKNADLTIRFSSNEMELEGRGLKFRLGLLNQELMLRRFSDSEVTAEVAVPWRYRQGGSIIDISIEIV